MPVTRDTDGINRPERLEANARIGVRHAAVVARRRYPGPVGELVARELAVWEDFGYRFGDAQLIARLVDELMSPPKSP